MKSDDLITPAYRKEQEALHRLGNYGVSGDRWAPLVDALVLSHGLKSVLDYGCGRGYLKAVCTVPIREYDPAVDLKNTLPEPADLVVCVDVLEHVEMATLPSVLRHLKELSRRFLFVNISLRESTKTLSDGRNAHITILPSKQWEALFAKIGFRALFWQARKNELNGLLIVPRKGVKR